MDSNYFTLYENDIQNEPKFIQKRGNKVSNMSTVGDVYLKVNNGILAVFKTKLYCYMYHRVDQMIT